MTNAREEQYKAEIKELRLKLRNVENECEARFEKDLDAAIRRAEDAELQVQKLVVAFVAVNDAAMNAAAALTLSDINPRVIGSLSIQK